MTWRLRPGQFVYAPGDLVGMLLRTTPNAYDDPTLSCWLKHIIYVSDGEYKPGKAFCVPTGEYIFCVALESETRRAEFSPYISYVEDDWYWWHVIYQGERYLMDNSLHSLHSTLEKIDDQTT